MSQNEKGRRRAIMFLCRQSPLACRGERTCPSHCPGSLSISTPSDSQLKKNNYCFVEDKLWDPSGSIFQFKWCREESRVIPNPSNVSFLLLFFFYFVLLMMWSCHVVVDYRPRSSLYGQFSLCYQSLPIDRQISIHFFLSLSFFYFFYGTRFYL